MLHGRPASSPKTITLLACLIVVGCRPTAPEVDDGTPPANGSAGGASLPVPPGVTPSPGSSTGGKAPSPAPGAGSAPAPRSGGGEDSTPGADPTEPMPPVDPGPPVPAPIPPNAKEGLPDKALVVYWGQNGTGGRSPGDMTTYEKELDETCDENPQYDALVLGFVITFGDALNASGAPRLNFSFHCETAYDEANPLLLRCPQIGRGIVACQQKRKKVLLSLGGASGSYTFTSDAQAESFAQMVWEMFMGGNGAIRPFGSAIVDGIDLDIEGGLTSGYTAFVRKLRTLTKTDTSRRYLITGAPQCVFPDAYMGPAPGKVLGDAADAFDYLWVQFYNNHCFFGGATFADSLASWTKLVGPKIFIGLPAAPDAGGGYVDPGTLGGLTGLVGRGGSSPQGIMLWDASYDRLNRATGQAYSAKVAQLLGRAQLPGQ